VALPLQFLNGVAMSNSLVASIPTGPEGTYAGRRGPNDDFMSRFCAPTWRKMDDPKPTSGRRRALAIAICYASGTVPSKLPGTYNDANNVIRMLERFGYEANDICVLADIEIRRCDPTGIARDMSRQPTRENIVKAIQWLGEGSGDRQNRFLCFTGHGHIQNYPTNNGIESREGIFPCDIGFESLKRCEVCVCEENHWGVIKSDANREVERHMPSLLTVLWDYNLNFLLTSVIMPGTKFTVRLCAPSLRSHYHINLAPFRLYLIVAIAGVH
ncbi:unnamed protein product, partial [Rhizoctonia solani]